MSGCCDPSGYRRFFNSKEAARAARSYRKRGLDGTAGPMVGALEPVLDGVTVLEGGSGSGSAHVEMLRRGAGRAVSVDISDAYEPIADAIAADHGVADRIDRFVGDFVTMELPDADVVFLNRVVCCYPDMEGMVDAAARRSRRMVALSYPRNRWFIRMGLRLVNRFLRFRNVPFSVFVHDPEAIERRLASAGFGPRAGGDTFVWHWRVFERAA